MQDVVRVVAAVPPVSVGDVSQNLARIEEKLCAAQELSPALTVFPELSLTGYTCADLFLQQTLREEALAALRELVLFSRGCQGAIAVGLPLQVHGRLYSVAAVIAAGRLYGLVTKTYLPTYAEFYEKRWFSSGAALDTDTVTPEELGLADLQSEPVPVGQGLIFDMGGVRFGAELCEDLWAPVTPGSLLALGGAEIIVNLSASNETVAKRAYRRDLVRMHSASALDGYVYVSAGCTESTTDLIFSGHSLIAAGGTILAENGKAVDDDYLLPADIDLGRLRADRLRNKTYADTAALHRDGLHTRYISLPVRPAESDGTLLPLRRLPFVPAARRDRVQRCTDIFEMQVMGLKKRLDVTGARPVIGVSGGLDSTLALLVVTEATRRCGRPLTDAVGITMPCFGTTDRTYRNSLLLMESLGITSVEIPIAAAVEQHFTDIGQDRQQLDLTFENAQARERTQVLMDYAGKIGGLVVGTGDLSELALGWCTYNADHMSMYGVNAGVPKTLVRWMVSSLLEAERFPASAAVLQDILDTPISPELLPPDEKGQIAQQTEQIVGPYALHDFFLYYTVRYGFPPEKTYALACLAFADEIEPGTVKKWLLTFYRRFFSQQFKRSCLPDGVKIGSICLSPRGDWRMPSDASAAAWLRRTEAL